MEHRGRILSGGDLISIRSKGGTKELPEIGVKDLSPDGSWLESQQIRTALGERHELLADERVEKLSSLSSAEWIPEEKMAKVVSKVGKMWEVFGYHNDQGDWLRPEEALFLLETNSLELIFGGIRVSIERGYYILLGSGNGCSVTEYRVYSHLNRLGYRVVRHCPDMAVTRHERLDGIPEGRKQDESPSRGEEEKEPEDVERSASAIEVVDEQPGPSIPNDNEKMEVFTVEDEECAEEQAGKESPPLMEEVDDDVILVEDNNQNDQREELISCSSASSVTSESTTEIICVLGKSPSVNRWSVYQTKDAFLATHSSRKRGPSSSTCDNEDDDVIDLSRDDDSNTSSPLFIDKKPTLDLPNFIPVDSKTREEILDSFPSALYGVSYLKKPESRFIPPNICPRYDEYRVNLNVRPDRSNSGSSDRRGNWDADSRSMADPVETQRPAIQPLLQPTTMYNRGGSGGGNYFNRNRGYMDLVPLYGRGYPEASVDHWRNGTNHQSLPLTFRPARPPFLLQPTDGFGSCHYCNNRTAEVDSQPKPVLTNELRARDNRSRFFNPVQNPLVRQAQEMQAMAIGMMQTATHLLSLQSMASPHAQSQGMYGLQQPAPFWGGGGQQRQRSTRMWRPKYPRHRQPRRYFHQNSNGAWENGYWRSHGPRPLKPFNNQKKSPDIICLDLEDSENDDETRPNGSRKRMKRESDEVAVLKSEPGVVNGEVNDVEVIEIKEEGARGINDLEIVELGGAEDVEIVDVKPTRGSGRLVEIVDLESAAPKSKAEVTNTSTERAGTLSGTVDVIDVDVKQEERFVTMDRGAVKAEKSGVVKNETIKAEGTDEGKKELEVEIIGGTMADFKAEETVDGGTKLSDVGDNTEDNIPDDLLKNCGTSRQTASNWSEFKLNYRLEAERMEEEAGASQIHLLLKPTDCTSFGNVLARLQIFRSFNSDQTSLLEKGDNVLDDWSGQGSARLQVSYDVYLPSVHFKKSLKMSPNFRVIVIEADCEVPLPVEMGVLRQHYDDDVPFLFAVVSEESIAFFLHDSVCLPLLAGP